MTKTNFVHGTMVTPEFLNAINNPAYSATPSADGEIPYPDLEGAGVTAAIAAETERAEGIEEDLQTALDVNEAALVSENSRAIAAEALLRRLIPDRFIIDITNPVDSSPIDAQRATVYSNHLSPDFDFSLSETEVDVNGTPLLCFVFDLALMNPGSSLFVFNSLSYQIRPARILVDGATYDDRLGYDVKVKAGSQPLTLILPDHIPDDASPTKTWKTFVVPAGEEHRIVYDLSGGSVRYTEYKAIQIG